MATKSIVDELFIRLSVDDNTAKGINKALGNLNKLNTAASQKTKKSFATMASNVSKSMAKVSKSISRVGKSMFRSLTLPLLATALAAIKLGTDFTASMNRVRATTQATAEEFERLESTAKRLGATTPKSARDIAKGMATLGLAGFEAVDVLNAIPQVTNLSIISFQNMEKSAQDAADLMSQFNIEAKDLGRAVDVLAVAATNSNTTVDQMIQGFKFAGPIASQLGISLEATAAVMGTLANSGIRAGIAGRALRMGLLNLSAPSSKAAKEMKNLGFSAFDTEGKFKTVDIILEDLNKSMDGYSAASKNVALRNIFGARAIGPFTKLLDQQAKTVTITQEMYGEMGNSLDALQLDVGDTISSFKLFELQMENSQGRGEELAKVFQEGLPGAMALLKSAAEGALLKLQEELETPTMEAAQFFTDLFTAFALLDDQEAVDTLTTTKERVVELQTALENIQKTWQPILENIPLIGQYFKDADMDTAQFITRLAILVGAIGPLLIGFGLLVGFIGKLITVFGWLWTIGTKVWAVLQAIWAGITIVAGVTGIAVGWIIALVLAIVLIIAAIIIWRKEIWAFIKKTWAAFKEWFAKLGPALATFFSNMWESIKNFFVKAWEGTKTFFTNMWNSFVTGLANIWTAVTEFFVNLWTSFVEGLDKLWQLVVAFFTFLKENWKEILMLVVALIVAFFIKIVQLFIAGIVVIVTFFINLFTTIRDFMNSIWDAIFQFVADIIAAIIHFFQNFDTIMLGLIAAMVFKVKEWFASLVEWTKKTYAAVIDWIKKAFTAVKDWLVDTFNTIKTKIKEAFNKIIETAGKFFTDMWDKIKKFFNDAVDKVTYFVQNFDEIVAGIWDSIKSAFSDVITGIGNFLTDIWEKLKEVGGAIIDGIKMGIELGLTGVLNKIKEMANGLIDKFKGILGINSPSTVFAGFGGNIVSGIIDGIKGGAGALFSAIGTLGSNIASKFSSIWDGVKNWISKIGSASANGTSATSSAGYSLARGTTAASIASSHQSLADARNAAQRTVSKSLRGGGRQLDFDGQEGGPKTVTVEQNNTFNTGASTREIEEMLRRDRINARTAYEVM